MIPAVDGCAYSPADGRGKNVGVEGREVGVGIELVVAVVLTLAAESRDCGRRIPVFIVLLYSDAPLSCCTGGDGAAVDAPRRNEAGAGGLEVRLRSFSTSLIGDGESSIMRTQPDVSAAGVRLALVSSSTLRLPGAAFIVRSSTVLPRIELERIVLAAVEATGEYGPAGFTDKVNVALALAFARLVMLPIRNRGTRV